MTRRTAIFLALFAVALPLFAQKTSGTLAGVVVRNGVAVDAAKVELRRGSVVVAQTTAHDGRFRIEAPAGRYQLYVDDVATREVLLSPGIVSGIDATSHVDAESPLFATTFDAKLLEKLPLDSVFEATNYLPPGTTRLSTYGGGIAVTFFDGANSLGLQLPVEFFESAVVKNAGYGAEYGRATAGIVDAVTRNAIAPLNATAFAYYKPWTHDYGRTHGGITIGGPIVRDRLFAFAGIDHDRIDDRLYDGSRHQFTDDQVLLKGDYLASPHANVTASTIGRGTFRVIEASGSFVSDNTTIDATASQFNLPRSPYETDLVRLGATHTIGNHTIRAGGEELRADHAVYSPYTGGPVPPPLPRLINASRPAFWIADTWYAGNSIVVNGGIRSQSALGDTHWEPRLAVMWQPAGGAVHVAASHGIYTAEQVVGYLSVQPVHESRDTTAEVSMPRSGVAVRFIHRDIDLSNHDVALSRVFTTTAHYDGAELEWMHRFDNTWIRATYVRGQHQSAFTGDANIDAVKLIATITIAKLDLGATGTYQSAVPFDYSPYASSATSIDFRASYRLLESLTLIGDAVNILDDQSRFYSRRSGIRWRL